MKLINFLFIWCVLQVSVNAQSVSELISQAQKLELQKNESAALEKYKQALLTDKHNLDALCGASFMCARIGNRETNSDKKNAYFRTAKVFAEEAMKINPNSSNANYMMAVAMGRIALISGPRDKVAASRDIKKFASTAVKLDPAQRGAWHVLGKYNYEVSNLNFAERGAAKLLFGGLPPGDLKTAIQCYEKCRALDATYIVNLHDLAKAYLQDDQKDKAKAVLNQALNLPEKFQDDVFYKSECRKLLAEIR